MHKKSFLETVNKLLVGVMAAFLSHGIWATEPRISVGGDHMLLVKADGSLWSWGSNSWGQLGLENVSVRNFPSQIPNAAGFIDVIARNSFSLALKADGTVWAWGDDSDGRVGPYNDRTRRPVQVTGLSNIVAIGASWGYTAFAIDIDGRVWAWGSNSSGQFGTGQSSIGRNPTPSIVPNLENVVGISAADDTVLALLADGTAQAWGNNTHGTLGVSASGSIVKPSLVTGLSGLQAVGEVNINTANGHFALSGDGAVWSWGDSNFTTVDCGQNRPNPDGYRSPVRLNNLASVIQVAGGENHVLFLTEAGAISGCGQNSSGQLGDGTRVETNSTKVGPIATSSLTNIRWISAGNNASAAIGSDGGIWTWGATSGGRSGAGIDGDGNLYHTAPVRININGGSGTAYPEIFAGTQSGALSNTSVDVGLAPAAQHVGLPGRMYFAAVLPDGNLLLLNESGGFVPFTSAASIPHFYAGELPRHLPLGFGTADYSALSGITLLLGYGVGTGDAAGTDMLQNNRYSVVLTLQ